MRQEHGEIYMSRAVAQVASFFEHDERLSNQISISVNQEKKLDECPWFIPDIHYLFQSVSHELVYGCRTKHTSRDSVRR